MRIYTSDKLTIGRLVLDGLPLERVKLGIWHTQYSLNGVQESDTVRVLEVGEKFTKIQSLKMADVIAFDLPIDKTIYHLTLFVKPTTFGDVIFVEDDYCE